MMTDKEQPWYGKVSGLVKESNAHFKADVRQRLAAERQPASVILTEKEVQGYWDANRVLETTLGGVRRQITTDDLAAFRQNMRVAQKRFGGGAGITARQVINLAAGNALYYTSPHSQYRSDIDKAKREITHAVAVSANNGTVRFITNASNEYGATRHVVIIKFLAFDEACSKLAAMRKPSERDCKKIAEWLRKQRLAFDCDCGRHRYFFRYVATIGGFEAGRKETAFPKIRNPGLNGVACKHVLRVMAEIESSPLVLRFLTKHLMNATDHKARTRLNQKQTEEQAKEQAKTNIDVDPSTVIKAKMLLRRVKNAVLKIQENSSYPARPANSSMVRNKNIKERIAEKFFSVKDGLFKLFGK